VDSGTNASSTGIELWNGGAPQQRITIRDLDIRGVDTGIIAAGPTVGLLLYNNDLRGNNVWTADYIETNLTWNDDGIRIPGTGNCAFQNTLHGFGDALAVVDGVTSTAVFFYRNRITMTGDDAFEADYATRNIGYYDNHIANSSTFLSLDPLWGGPLYAFRNVSLNTMRGPFKLNDTNSGFMIYHNTLVRTEGTTSWGFVQFNNGALNNWSFLNNALVYRGTTGQLLAIESPGMERMDFGNNAWFPDGQVWWTNSGGSFASLDAARAALPATTPLILSRTQRHDGDLLLASDPFAVVLGASHLTELASTVTPVAVPPQGALLGAGVALANINDGYAGAAPDIGAAITGRTVPSYGASR
jgi:hypothetical protein